MRKLSKPSTARCNADLYSLYLLSDPMYTSCTRLSEVMGDLSHDSVNRFLDRERYVPKDLFDEEKNKIDLIGGVLSVDDSVLDKPYSDPKKVHFVSYLWSGKHKRVVKGINLITLYYTDVHGVSVPVNYRLYDKSENKSKNDYFREMLSEVLAWGLSPSWVTGDAWYSNLANLKYIRKLGLNFLFGVESNRLISVKKGQYIQIQTVEDWPKQGALKTVYLKNYGNVKIIRQLYKKVYRYYIVGMADLSKLDEVTYVDFERLHKLHWKIETYHRAIKQVCNIERFQVRKEYSIRTHIFCSLSAFVKLELMRFEKNIDTWYQIKKELFLESMKKFIQQHEHANYQRAVNA